MFARAGIVVLGLCVYANALTAPFLFDDTHAIVENRHVRELWPSAPAQSALSGRPLVSVSLAVNAAVGGLSPVSLHAGNLAIHIACALLLFGIVRRTLSDWA